MATFETSVNIDTTANEAFDFLVRPANLPQITHQNVGLQLVKVPERFASGVRFEFQMTGFGPPQHFVHEITRFEESSRFTEEQIQGPLKRFVHEHLIEPDGNGAIVVIDRVEFEPPGGLLRFVASEERILTSLKEAFAHRQNELKRILEQ